MDSLVQDRIYRRVAFMDYQGACSENGDSSFAAAEHIRPTMLSWIRDFVVVISMSWLSLLPGFTAAWPQISPDEYEADMDEYQSYDMDEDIYSTNDVVTVPEIVSGKENGLKLFNFYKISLLGLQPSI